MYFQVGRYYYFFFYIYINIGIFHIGKKKLFERKKKFRETFRVVTNSIFCSHRNRENRDEIHIDVIHAKRRGFFRVEEGKKIFPPRNLNSPFLQRSTSSRLNSNYSLHLKTDVIPETCERTRCNFSFLPHATSYCVNK